MTDDELLTMLQEACFRYYWEGAHPDSGMTRENLPGNDRIVATGASGFGVMALVVGVERGFITREQGVERLNKITDVPGKSAALSRCMVALHGRKNRRVAAGVFDVIDSGGDLVESSFMMQGLLAARQYFNRDNGQEKRIGAANHAPVGRDGMGLVSQDRRTAMRFTGIGRRSGAGSSITG